MASPYILSNADLQYSNLSGQNFNAYIAFLNPIAFTTNWQDLTLNQSSDQWQPPPNYDTAANHVAPYAPICNFGGNRIGFVNEELYFDGSRSCQRHDLPVPQQGIQWGATGPATINTYTQQQVGITWDSPGLYEVALTVQDNAGTNTTGTRQVYIYQDRASALPGIISISGLSGSLSSGGWSCQLTTVSSQVSLFPPDALPVGTYQPIVVMLETEYEIVPGLWVNRTMGPHGQFTPGQPYQDPRIFFDGYVQSGTIHQDVEKDTLSFSCSGIQMVLQEAKTHNLGYYNTTYTSINSIGVPAGLNPTPNGKGHLVGNLMTADVVHSLLQTHTNIAQYHDTHVWNANIPTNPYFKNSPIAYYNLVYTNLSINEGTLWSNIQDLVSNEWSSVYCEHDGSIRVGPQINYRGNEYWSQPTLLGPLAAAALINYVQELGFTVGNDLSTMGHFVPSANQLPALPVPLTLVHPWGHQPMPPQVSQPFQNTISPQVQKVQSILNGPPILCNFSDVPIYDQDTIPPQYVHLYPQTLSNWPQDLAVYPMVFEFQENYTGRTSLVKLIGTLANSNTLWSCWYPQNSFRVAGDGTSNIITTVLPAGNWMIDDRHLLPDATRKQNGTLLSNWWWEIARRVYYAQNINYTGSIQLGMFTAAALGDIVGVTRQNNSLGPHWSAKPFYVTQIDYNLDFNARTWNTTLSLVEVTSALLTPITPPPKVVPKG